MTPHVAKTSFNRDPNVGLYGVATDKFCLLSRSLSKNKVNEIKEILGVPVIQVNLYGTNLVGIFAAANSDTVLLPNIIYENEVEKLKKELDELNVKLHIIETEHTALGNNILLNDKAGIISTVYSKTIFDKLKEVLKIDLKQIDLAETSIPGSMGYITDRGGIFNPNISDKEIKVIENLFGFEIGLGTINMGNSFVSSGIIGNSNGFLIGTLSSGYEITRVDESLGFLG